MSESQAFPTEIAALGLEAPRFVWTQCELMRQRVSASKVTFLCLNAEVTASFNTARGRWCWDEAGEAGFERLT